MLAICILCNNHAYFTTECFENPYYLCVLALWSPCLAVFPHVALCQVCASYSKWSPGSQWGSPLRTKPRRPRPWKAISISTHVKSGWTHAAAAAAHGLAVFVYLLVLMLIKIIMTPKEHRVLHCGFTTQMLWVKWFVQRWEEKKFDQVATQFPLDCIAVTTP